MKEAGWLLFEADVSGDGVLQEEEFLTVMRRAKLFWMRTQEATVWEFPNMMDLPNQIIDCIQIRWWTYIQIVWVNWNIQTAGETAMF